MTSVPATATVLRDGRREDIAVPAGTTVAGIMAMLRVDVTDPDLSVTTADGTPVELGAVVGRDIPSGTLMALTGQRAGVQATLKARQQAGRAWFDTAVALVTTLLLVGMWELALIVAPLMELVDVDGPLRVGTSAACMLLLLSLVWRRADLALRPWAAVVLPGPFGVAVAGALGVPSLAVLTMVSAWAATLACALWWWWRGSPATAVAGVGWTLVALTCSASVMIGAPTGSVALLCAAIAVMVLCVVPDVVVRVSGSQLLDLTLLSRTVAALRTPSEPEPEAITGRRVERSLSAARTRLETVTWASLLVMVTLSPWAVAMAGLGSPERIAAMMAVMFMVSALLVMPRRLPSTSMQVMPRWGAAMVAVQLVVAVTAEIRMDPVMAAAGLVILASVVTLAVVVATGEPDSLVLGRLAEILQGWSLVLLLPCAMYGAGLVDYLWRAAS